MFARQLFVFVAAASVLLTGLWACHQKDEASGSSTSQPMADNSSPPSSTSPSRILGVEPGWELAPQARYTASQTSGEVIIKASGENPTGGYETKLVQSPLRIWPPQYMLVRKKPDGMVTQVITAFEVRTSFKATDPIRELRVRDAAGSHTVSIEQARD
jgi:hypothetical protein